MLVLKPFRIENPRVLKMATTEEQSKRSFSVLPAIFKSKKYVNRASLSERR